MIDLEEFKTKAHVSQVIKNLFYEYAPLNKEFINIQETLDEITDRLAEELAEFIVESRYTNSQVYNLRLLLDLYGKVLDSTYCSEDLLK